MRAEREAMRTVLKANGFFTRGNQWFAEMPDDNVEGPMTMEESWDLMEQSDALPCLSDSDVIPRTTSEEG